MIVPFRLNDSHDIEPHHFRVYEATSNGSDNWLEPIAEEYVRILSHRETRLRSINITDDSDMDMSRLKQYIIKASVPNYEAGNFNVVRSDFGELRPEPTARENRGHTLSDDPREARIVLSDSAFGTGQATVVLRPVNLLHLEELVTGAMTTRNERERRAFAEWLVFGGGE